MIGVQYKKKKKKTDANVLRQRKWININVLVWCIRGLINISGVSFPRSKIYSRKNSRSIVTAFHKKIHFRCVTSQFRKIRHDTYVTLVMILLFDKSLFPNRYVSIFDSGCVLILKEIFERKGIFDESFIFALTRWQFTKIINSKILSFFDPDFERQKFHLWCYRRYENTDRGKNLSHFEWRKRDCIKRLINSH